MEITQKQLKRLLDYNLGTGLFKWKTRRHGIKSNNIAGCNSHGYIHIKIDGKQYQAHRLAWLYIYGGLPEYEIDHINHNRSDNKISNLREATRTENNKNMPIRKDNKSGISGVFWNKKDRRWTAQINVNSKLKHLGSFTNISNAKRVREEAKIKYDYHPNHA